MNYVSLEERIIYIIVYEMKVSGSVCYSKKHESNSITKKNLSLKSTHTAKLFQEWSNYKSFELWILHFPQRKLLTLTLESSRKLERTQRGPLFHRGRLLSLKRTASAMICWCPKNGGTLPEYYCFK